MKSMKNILAEFREYSEKVNSLEKIIESRETRKKQLAEDREVFNEVSRNSSEKIYDWMRETDGMPYDFETLFDGAMRTYIPLVSEEQMKLSTIVKALRQAGWGVPANPKYDGSIKSFPVNKVKQKLQRLQADGGGEYEVEVDVADLRLVRKTQKVIPAGPRQGQTVEKKEDTTMSKAVARMAKSGKISKDLLRWWQNTQGTYTRDGNQKTIESTFEGNDGSQYSIVLSRHPIDVLRMSDISNIRSCHSEHSEYFHCAVAEAKGHGPIAYLVETESLENHLMDKPADGSPSEMLDAAWLGLDRDAYREKMAKEFDLESPAGRWVYLETWASSRAGSSWLKNIEGRIEMASVPEKFRNQSFTAMARQLDIPLESLIEYYGVWTEGGNALFNYPQDKLEGYEEARKAVYEREPAPNDLKPLSDFDDQELFRDRDRSIQGIGAKARLRLRKFEEPMRFGTFAGPENRLYGIHVPGFKSAVMKWAVEGQREQFLDDDGEVSYPRFEDLTRRGGSYGDNRDGEILNNFLEVMSNAGDDWERPYGNYDTDREDDDEENEMEAMFEQYEERVSELNDHASNTLEHASCHAEVEDTGDGQPYVYASADISYRIPLPWHAFAEDADGDYIHVGEDGNPVDEEAFIPKSWGGDWQRRNAFESALTDMLDYYSEETEWEVLTHNERVYLDVRHMFRMEDGTEPDDYDSFIDYIESDIDRNYRENIEKIRKSLVESEYIGPNDWDNLQDDMSEMEESLKNWTVIGIGDDDGEVIFSLKPEGTGRYHMRTGIRWPYPASSPLSSTATMKGLFGGESKTFGIERYLSFSGGSSGTVQAKGGILFQRAFRGLQDAANEYAKRQMALPFGSEYEEKYEPIAMGKNVELGMVLADPKSGEDPNNPDALEIGFIMKVRVYSEDRSDEIEAAFNFVKYIDSNMDSLKQAVVNAFSDEVLAWEEQRKADERAMADGTSMRRHAKMLRLQWDEAADNGNLTGEAIMILVMWTEQNFEKMETTAERWVATDILRLHLDGPRGTIWDPTVDLPVNWVHKVKGKMVNLGATFNQKESYKADYLSGNPAPEVYSQEGDDEPTLQGTLGEPQPAQEAKLKEEIYKRLQKKILKKKVKIHLTEKITEKKRLQKEKVRDLVKSKLSAQGLTEADLGYTQRTYKINFRIAMAKEHGGKREETENEMRAVPGVGTVKIIQGSTRQDGGNYYADVLIKFHLLGKRSVVQYVRMELLPALRSIEGLSVLRMDRYEEITTMREWADAYANAGASPQQGSGTASRATPTPTIDAIAQDWMNVGASGTANIHASSLAHSVAEVTMIPVGELMRYLGTNYFSATTVEFESLKQQIMNNGVPHPVQIIIGKNGTIKVSDGDDIVLAAKDIGLKEIPVTFNLVLQI